MDLTADAGKVIALLKDGKPVEQLNKGDVGAIVLDRTPFYAESGGQVGDKGELISAVGAGKGAENTVRFTVEDTKKSGDAHVHVGTLVSGTMKTGATLQAQVDNASRTATVLNHSATHLLHAALRKPLGTHVTQKGSLVAPDKLRFDFSHYEALTPAQLAQLEKLDGQPAPAGCQPGWLRQPLRCRHQQQRHGDHGRLRPAACPLRRAPFFHRRCPCSSWGCRPASGPERAVIAVLVRTDTGWKLQQLHTS